MNAFIAFLVNDCNVLVKQSIKTAIKICAKQEIPIEELRFRRKKKMPGKQQIQRFSFVSFLQFWMEVVRAKNIYSEEVCHWKTVPTR